VVSTITRLQTAEFNLQRSPLPWILVVAFAPAPAVHWTRRHVVAFGSLSHEKKCRDTAFLSTHTTTKADEAPPPTEGDDDLFAVLSNFALTSSTSKISVL
jgi:hypothetical protein